MTTGTLSATQATPAQLLTFKLDEQDYALDIANVVQVVRMVAVTRPPNTPEYVEGMINLRGKVIPVIDTRKRCGLAAQPHDLNTQLLIARANDRTLALIVDVVSEVLTLPADSLESPEAIGVALQHLAAVGKLDDRLLLILDPNTLLADNEDIDSLQVAAR
ncbi:MAG TPA: chemotaxis protein CheW [Anaerolineae bacterium]|nr:chemotaxis protein CheW [Anaerolineae bacterium]